MVDNFATCPKKWKRLHKYILSGNPTDIQDEHTPPIDTLPYKTQLSSLRKRLKSHEKQAIIEKYQAGESTRTLAKKYHCGHQTVSKVLKDAGIPLRYRPLTSEQIEQILRLREQGLSIVAIGKELDIPRSTVGDCVKLNSIT